MNVLALITALAGAIGKFFSWLSQKQAKDAGKAEAENEHLKTKIKADKTRNEKDEEVEKLSDDDVDSRLSKWVRPGNDN